MFKNGKKNECVKIRLNFSLVIFGINLLALIKKVKTLKKYFKNSIFSNISYILRIFIYILVPLDELNTNIYKTCR